MVKKSPPKLVARAARDGDRLAAEVWAETIEFLSIGIDNVITTLAPEAVIIGGVTLIGEQLLLSLRTAIKRRVRMLPVE